MCWIMVLFTLEAPGLGHSLLWTRNALLKVKLPVLDRFLKRSLLVNLMLQQLGTYVIRIELAQYV